MKAPFGEMRKVRIERRARRVVECAGRRVEAPEAPPSWFVVDLDTGIAFKKFDSFAAAKGFCVKSGYDFGQFGRLVGKDARRAKSPKAERHDRAAGKEPGK